MKLEEIINLDKKYYMNTFGDRLPVAFERGNGINLYSVSGDKYYDFFGGIAVNSLGHNYKPLVKTIENQARKIMHCSNVYYIENQAKLAQLICENSCGEKVFFCNSGAEANEGAIKLVRKYFYNKGIDKCEIITLKNSFHGRTITTISATGQEKYQKPFAPLTEKFVYVERNNIEELYNAVNEKTAAIMIELIQGESGVQPLSNEYIKEIRKICDEKGIIMVVDEVQTGIGRLGTLFGYQKFDIEPDIFTLAKGLGGGMPIGAVVAKDEFAAFTPGDHGTTFGGNPLACACGLCVLTELTDNYVLYRANRASSYFFEELLKLKEKYSLIKEIRGKGLMIGIEFKEEIAKEVSKKLFDKKILAGVVGTSTLRLLPPLVVEKKDIDLFIKIFDEILKETC